MQRWMMGYFVLHWIIFWLEGRLGVPVYPASPNELSPRESSLQQTHFWVRTHQPWEQISGNYCIRLMILSSGKYFIPCWVSQALSSISLCCAADKDPQVYGMLLTLFHPNSFDFGQYSASISSWRSYWFIPNSPTQDHTSELAAALWSWARWNKSRFLDTMLFILLFQLLLKQGNF